MVGKKRYGRKIKKSTLRYRRRAGPYQRRVMQNAALRNLILSYLLGPSAQRSWNRYSRRK